MPHQPRPRRRWDQLVPPRGPAAARRGSERVPATMPPRRRLLILPAEVSDGSARGAMSGAASSGVQPASAVRHGGQSGVLVVGRRDVRIKVDKPASPAFLARERAVPEPFSSRIR